MKKRYKLGIVGSGFMSRSILCGIVNSDFLRGKHIVVSDISESALDRAAELNIVGTNNNKYISENCEFVLLAVKPQNFDDVVKGMGGVYPQKVISIMAGVKRDRIKASFGRDIKVARCMPNLACAIGSGVTGIDLTDFDRSREDVNFITGIFKCMGKAVNIKEEKMDAVTGISGSGPAYVFMFIDSLIDAGVKHGLTKSEATTLAVQTVIGGAEMVEGAQLPVPELIKRVCSKGGTTIEAVKVLEGRNFRAIVDEAVTACVKRSKELSD